MLLLFPTSLQLLPIADESTATWRLELRRICLSVRRELNSRGQRAACGLHSLFCSPVFRLQSANVDVESLQWCVCWLLWHLKSCSSNLPFDLGMFGLQAAVFGASGDVKQFCSFLHPGLCCLEFVLACQLVILATGIPYIMSLQDNLKRTVMQNVNTLQSSSGLTVKASFTMNVRSPQNRWDRGSVAASAGKY